MQQDVTSYARDATWWSFQTINCFLH